MISKENTLDFIVHIGTGKTGSTSIQQTLANNKQVLYQNKTVYLGLNFEGSPFQKYPWQRNTGWHELLNSGKKNAEQQLQEVLDETIAALKRKGIRRAIWSNESIFENDGRIIPVLNNARQAGLNIKIVVYVRRHDAWARSAYLQWGIKHKTYAGPIKSFMEWYQSRDLKLYPNVKRWLDENWSAMSVRNFDRCGDVVEDFLTYCGLQQAEMDSIRGNETPNATALALWALFNAQSDMKILPDELGVVMASAGLLHGNVKECDYNELLPKLGEIKSIQDDLSEDRRQIDTLLNQCSQPEMETTLLEHKKITCTQNQVNAALLMMLKSQKTEINTLREEVDRLSKKNLQTRN